MQYRPLHSQACRICLGLAAVLVAVVAAAGALAGVIDGRVAYLAATADKTDDTFNGSIRFARTPAPGQLQDLERRGVRFGEHHSRTVYPAIIPFAQLDSISRCVDVAGIDCAWRPRACPPLARSALVVEADQVWAMASPRGGTVTGKGVTIGDIDTGVDVRHASFFVLTDERFDWLDLDGSGGLSAGDAVDLDGDNRFGPGEALAHREAIGTARYGNVLGVYDTDLDYLFNDRDADGNWDQGPPEYGENDPCFGERLFLCDDLDGNRRLDPGEGLLGLGGSRIRAVMDRDGSIHRRGIDLLAGDGDTWGHGTQVTGIAIGGWPGRHRMTGIAPGAEMLHFTMELRDDAPFLRPIEDGLAWAVAEGADVVLFEDGEWIWEFLDGSSNLEMMMNEYAAEQGVILIAPVGNLAWGNMHARFDSDGGQGLGLETDVAVAWVSFLWTGARGLGLRVTPPGQSGHTLPLDGSITRLGAFDVFSNLSVSERGTHRLDLRLAAATEAAPIGGRWAFEFVGGQAWIHGYFAEDVSTWQSPSRWAIGTDTASTVTWPATADSNIGVAALDADHDNQPILPFSGRGPRIDGANLVDVAAPGVNVSTADPSNTNGFINFGGTSSAGPHVAGAVALLKELAPDLDHAAARRYLRAGAMSLAPEADAPAAGAGRLRIHRSVLRLLEDMSATAATSAQVVETYPNPSSAGTTIRFHQHREGAAMIRLFDVAGREVWSGSLATAVAGWRAVSWDGLDRDGRPLPSGVYFAHVRQDGAAGAGKLVLLR
jgi:subtilisin family serine protease